MVTDRSFPVCGNWHET